jgi:hypothetical protein
MTPTAVTITLRMDFGCGLKMLIISKILEKLTEEGKVTITKQEVSHHIAWRHMEIRQQVIGGQEVRGMFVPEETKYVTR